MAVALFALALSLILVALTLPLGRAWKRGRRVVLGKDPGRSTLVVVALPHGANPGRALARSLAAAVHGGPLALRVGCPPGEAAGERWIEEVHRAAPALEARAVVSEPPARCVPAAWLAAEAVRGNACEVVGLADLRARPTARDLACLLACPGTAGVSWVAAVPVRGTGAGARAALWSCVSSDLAPMMAAACGPAGLPTVLVAGTREALAATLEDPLGLNRPSLAASAALRAGAGAALVPVPVALEPGCEGRELRAFLKVLWRACPGGAFGVVVSLAALPLALVAWALAGGVAREVAATAALLAWTARAAAAATWTRSTRGPGAALVAGLMAPLRDAVSVMVLVAAAGSTRVVSGGRRFRIRRGGILVPAGSVRPRGLE